ncbi:MAG: OmpA family protein [Bacteroidales bacterium]
MANLSSKILTLVFLFLLVSTFSYSQQTELSTSSRRARSAFERGFDHYRLMQFDEAETEFKKAIDIDDDFIEAYIILGEMLHYQKKYSESKEYLEEAISINQDFYPFTFFLLGESHFKTGYYKEALENFNVFLEYENYDPPTYKKIVRYLENCEFAIIAMENPVPFDPVNLGESINSEHAEYSPVLTADGQTLIFTRKRPRTNPEHLIYGEEYEDFYISKLTNSDWSDAVNIGSPINTPRNEGAQSITADGRHLYFTACGRPDGFGSCDIYYSQKKGRQWSIPNNLGETINSSKWDSQPSISADGQTLFFTSGRDSNIGHMDIWVSYKDEDGNWQEPENLGETINTTGKEMSPFIHPDNRTLFFASDGHPGMGELDLYLTRKDENGEWTRPVNLGYPINTHAEEMSLFISASGKEAYFASDKLGGFGDWDIYFFELYEQARPDPVTYMKGIVYDSKTRERLEAQFELIDLKQDTTLINSTSSPNTGGFLVAIPTGKNLGLNVSKEGYLFFSENFQYTDVKEGIDPYIRDIELHPIRQGETVVLRNIFFETDKYELLPESISELKRLINLLDNNPSLKIEISGHTDSVGTYEYNLELSKNRARSVFNFLVDNGISKSRLTYKGYADTKPIDTNETKEGRANNRRTEFKIIELNNKN